MPNIRVFLLWVPLLPWCFCNNEHPIHFLSSDRKFCISNCLTRVDVTMIPDNVEYVERQFYLRQNSRYPSPPEVILDTPTDIARKVVNHIKSDDGQPLPIIFVSGDVMTGKSVSLAKIQLEINQLMPKVRTIRADLSEVFKNRLPHDITLDAIGSSPFVKFFGNILETNPKQIVLLLDGLDRMDDKQVEKIATIIDDATKKSTTVVATGRKHTLIQLEARGLTIMVYEIPEMKIHEVKQYLTNIWTPMISDEISNTDSEPSPPKKLKSDFHPYYKERLKEYVTAFTTVLFKTSLPRTTMVLKQLAHQFGHLSSKLSSVQSDTEFHVGCFDYVLGQTSLPQSIDIVIENILFNKMSFFDDMTTIIRHRQKDLSDLMIGKSDVDTYGPLAVMKTLFNTEDQRPKHKSLKTKLVNQIEELRSKPHHALTYVNPNRASTYDFDFINSQFMYYFAAKYIVSFIETDIRPTSNSIPILLLRQIFSDSRYMPMLEFMNGAAASINPIVLKRIAGKDQKMRDKILDNLLQFGLQDLFVKIGTLLIYNRSKYETYFEKYIVDRNFIEHSVKHIFGMVSLIERQPNPDFFDLPCKYNRLELLVEQNMVRLLKPRSKFIKKFIELKEYQRLLRIAVTRDIPDRKEVMMILDLSDNNIRVNFGDLLFHSIDKVGIGCRPISNFLFSKGVDQPIINEDGRTLLHAAVRWHSKSLLQYVVEDLHVNTVNSIDRLGKTVFQRALHAKPSSKYLSSAWWEMMSYLVEHMKYISRPMIREFLLNSESFTSLTNSVLQEFLQENPEISPLEELIRCRDIGPMSPQDRNHYRKIITTFIEREQDSITPAMRIRIFDVLVDKTTNIDDLTDFKYAIDVGLLHGVELTSRLEIMSKLQSRFRVTISVDAPSTSAQALQLVELDHEVTELLESIKIQMYSDINDINVPDIMDEEYLTDILNCLERHTRRAATLSGPCRFSWKDVDDFNDADERRTIKLISVNSDKLLEKLAIEEFRDRRKAQQLMQLVKELPSVSDVTGRFITGKSQMLLRDVLQHQSLTAYRQKLRITDVINDVSQQFSRKESFAFRFSSNTVALHVASTIPLIRGIYGTIVACRQAVNGTNTDCWIGSSALAVPIISMPVNMLAPRYVPRTIQWLSRTTLDILPSTMPYVIRQNVLQLRHIGLKYGTAAVVYGLTAVSMGFDIYNIIEMSKMIDECSKEGDKCLSKHKIDYIISLTFSCMSIVVTGGLMLSGVGFAAGLITGLALVIIESLALGINEVVYYSNKYNTDWNENARIFFHKIGFQPLPADVQALAQRTDWVNDLQQRVTQLLDASNENIVAYGTGIGTFRNGEVIASAGSINMAEVNVNHTRGLSRVIPVTRDNMILLCLPKQDKTSNFDKHPNSVSDAVYGCYNTFVIAHKKRWEQRSREKSHILFNLEYIEEGDIMGSNMLNNIFLIKNGTQDFNVTGGIGNITNTFVIENSLFHGIIGVDSKSRKNVLDLSATKSSILKFTWLAGFMTGRVKFDNNDYFWVVTSGQRSPSLHVIGRSSKPDIFACDYNNHDHHSNDRQSISVDGAGGKSHSKMDHIKDCEISMVRPFTHIKGSNSSSLVYTTYVWLEYAISKPTTTRTIVSAIIEPDQSKFMVVFINNFLFRNIYSVRYTPRSKTLTWRLRYIDSSTLSLSIVPYHIGNSPMKQNTTISELESINCVFIDSYTGSTVIPVIHHQPADGFSTVTVRHFNVFATVNDSQIIDIASRYNNMNSHVSNKLHVVTKLTYRTTGQSFTFGSNTHDRFYIDGNTTFLFGGDGSDVYVLNRESPNYVLIENEANDDALDTLIILDGICDSLHAERGALSFPCCKNSSYDVTLFCSINRPTTTSSPIHVVLRNYLLHPRHRHLQIHWHDAMYMLLPHQWTQDNHRDNAGGEIPKIINLALLFSFGDKWPFTTLTVTNGNRYIILNIIDEDMNPLVASRSETNNVVLSRKYLDRNSSSFVVLQEFFSNNTTNVAAEWLKMRIFIVHDTMNDRIMPRILTVEDIRKLILTTSVADNTTHKQATADFIQEYFCNVTDTSRGNTIVIEHNYNSVIHGVSKLGVLTLVGAEPKEFYGFWSDNGTTLSLCARQTCIYVKHWCRPIHRLYRMEFISSLNHRPIVIPHMDRINCQRNQFNNNISPLDTIFINAQHQLLLANNGDDSDNSRLVRCVSSIFVDYVAHNSMHRPLGFTSVVEQEIFMRDNCRVLFTRPDLKKVSMAVMNGTLENTIKRYEISEEATSEDEASILLVRKAFSKLDNLCWEKFMASLYNLSNTTEYNVSAAFQILEEVNVICQHVFNQFSQ